MQFQMFSSITISTKCWNFSSHLCFNGILVLPLSYRLKFPNAHVAHAHECSSDISKSIWQKTNLWLPPYFPSHFSSVPSHAETSVILHSPHLSPLLSNWSAGSVEFILQCLLYMSLPFHFSYPRWVSSLLTGTAPLSCYTSASFGCSESSLCCVGASLVVLCEFSFPEWGSNVRWEVNQWAPRKVPILNPKYIWTYHSPTQWLLLYLQDKVETCLASPESTLAVF